MKLKILLLIIFTLISGRVLADFATCEKGDINFSGSTFDSICNGGNRKEAIVGLESYSGATQDLKVGSFGNNFSFSKKSKDVYSYYAGFLGSHFKGRTVVFGYDLSPTGVLSSYIGKDIIIPEAYSKTYKDGEKNYSFTKSNGSSKNSQNKCKEVNDIKNIKAKIIKGAYSDYINISWDKHEDSIKVMQILPKQKIFYLESKNEFREYDLKESRDYVFYIIAYNDCGGVRYSSNINISYKKQILSEPYLALDNNILRLKNIKELGGSDIKLNCSLLGENIDLGVFDENYSIFVEEKYLNSPFSCYVQYIDKQLVAKNTKIFINDILNGIYLSNLDAITILAQTRQAKDFFEKNLYYIYDKINLEDDLSYNSFSLLLLNINGKIPLDDSNLSLSVLKKLNIVKNPVLGKNRITKQNFFEIYAKIYSNNNFEQDLREALKNDFNLSSQQAFLKIQKSYYVNKELKKLDKDSRDILLDCYSYGICRDFSLYKEFDIKVNSFLREKEYENLGIKKGVNISVLKDYTNLIYKTFGKKGFYEHNFSVKQYNIFSDILLKAVFYNEDIENDKLDYFSILRINILLLDTDLDKKIEKLTKYLKEINTIYEKLDDKSRLLNILKNYINK